MMITDLGYTVVTKGLNDSGQYKIRSEDRETLFSSLEDRTTEGRSETTERRQGDGSSVLTKHTPGTIMVAGGVSYSSGEIMVYNFSQSTRERYGDEGK